MVETLVEQVAWLNPISLFLLLNVVIATILVSSVFQGKKHPPQQDHHHQPPNLNQHHYYDGNEYHHYHDGGEYHHYPSTTVPPQPAPLVRTPSLLSRVTSFNFNNYYRHNTTYDEEHQTQHGGLHGPIHTMSLLSRLASFKSSGSIHEPGPVPESAREVGQADHVTREVDSRKNAVVSPAPAAAKVAVQRQPSLLSRVASFTMGWTPQEVEVDGEADALHNNIFFDKKFGNDNNKNSNNVGSQQQRETKVVKKKKKKKKGAVKEPAPPIKREEKCHEVDVDAMAEDFINRFKKQLKLQRSESLMRYRST